MQNKSVTKSPFASSSFGIIFAAFLKSSSAWEGHKGYRGYQVNVFNTIQNIWGMVQIIFAFFEVFVRPGRVRGILGQYI